MQRILLENWLVYCIQCPLYSSGKEYTMSQFSLFVLPIPLSPSELILLNGENFAKKTVMGNTKLLHTDISVSYSQLGEAILISALLALQYQCNLEYELRTEKAMFGMRKGKAINVKLGMAQNDWSDYSLESQLIQNTTELAQEENPVMI